jgi:hypothetical protein
MESIKKQYLSKYWNSLRGVLTVQEEYIQKLDKIERELNIKQECREIRNPLKILMGPSLSVYPPCFIHDRIISFSLRLKEATIIPLYCDSIQTIECNVFGGVWAGNSFKESCKTCRERSELLWHNNPNKPLKLSNYINKAEISKIDKKIESLDKNWFDFEEGPFFFGKWAKDILVNNYVVGDYHLIPQFNELGKNHIRNLLLLNIAYHNIFHEIKPDRVVTNDSYYGMWAILQKICEQKGIPFYSHWAGGRPDGWCYAYNDAAMNLDFSKPWKSFANIPMNKDQIQKVKEWIDSRSTGKNMILDTASLQSFNTDDFDLSKIDLKKPTALLPSNVIWDLAALNKQIVFSDMISWIEETIRWFGDHPEYQLIIKSHPGELHPAIPETMERVEIALNQRNVKLPGNVILLTPRVKCTVYDLLPICNVGIVHTTTVGIEMAAKGIPVITTGKSPYRGFGFTIDPTTSDEYFNAIERCLSGEKILENRKQEEKAYKFILFYQFHYYTRIGIMEYTWGKIPQLKVQSIEDLLPGKNQCLDYIVDSIIEGKPIVSENRWPPES